MATTDSSSTSTATATSTTTYSVHDDGCTTEVVVTGEHDPQDMAQEAADELAEIYSEDATQSSLVHITVTCTAIDGVDLESHEQEYWTATAEVYPREPKCAKGRTHEWSQVGHPWGCGAGVCYIEQCSQCSWAKVTKTNRHDGGSDFYDSVSYEEREQD